MAVQLDRLGYVIATEAGVRCGSCKLRHADADSVRECYRQAADQEAQARAELEVERRTTRYYEEGF